MALESIAALGVASNVFQFLDFAWKLISASRTVYKSASNMTENNVALEIIASDVSRMSDSIVVSQSGSKELERLALESKRVADDLLAILRKLGINGTTTKWKSFVLAVKDVWSRDEILSFTGRLVGLQAQLGVHLQKLLL
jgi:hypothetical protein